MKRKSKSVSLDGLHLAMRLVLKLVDEIWDDYGQEAVITAGTEVFDTEGNLIHSSGSLHPFGRALDIRTNYFSEEDKIRVAQDLEDELGSDYDVVLHKSHLHVEYQP